MKIGLVVNPIAGMGGRVGLKGTDGMVEKARELGAEPHAPERARRALRVIYEECPSCEIITYAGDMGENQAIFEGFDPVVIGKPLDGETTAEDTKRAVEAFIDHEVDIILFVGGDGTAVDVASALEGLSASIPVLGVPAGVKVFSSVFGVNPEASSRIAVSFEETERREIVDLDETAYREGEVQTELKGIVDVPLDTELQSMKQLPGGTTAGMAEKFVEDIRRDKTYILGPGSTVGEIKRELGFDGSPLGVDVWRGGELVVEDANEKEILGELNGPSVIVVSPIGGQGFVFGRGNAQISPEIIRRSEIEIVGSKRKLDELGVLRVDTGDKEVDESLRGWHRVRVGRYERRMMKVV